MTKPDLRRKIQQILKLENINKIENAGAKQGLEKALDILDSNQRDLVGLNELESTQARAIAKFAVDFNNMKPCSAFFISLGESIEGKDLSSEDYKKIWKVMDEQMKK